MSGPSWAASGAVAFLYACTGAKAGGSGNTMLDYLRIRGLALLDDVALELGAGMNVLTGETGAGKSIIVDALGLLRGGRGRAEIVREGCDAARVEAQFGLDDASRERVRTILATRDFPLDDDALVVERTVGKAGRGRSSLQSRLTTRAVLEEVGGELVDICSQHEHHSLTHVSRHIELLDSFAGIDAAVDNYADSYIRWREVVRALESARDQTAERLQRADYLRFQIDELERLDLQPGEHAALVERATLLREAQRWRAFADETRARLYENDDAVASLVGGLRHRALQGAETSTVLAEIAEHLETAQIACEEAARAADALLDEVESEPMELEEVDGRLDEVEHLRRKHGCEADELLERLETMREELARIDDTEGSIASLEAEEEELRGQCMSRAEGLSQARHAAAAGLASAVESELAALHMGQARLEVSFDRVGEGAAGLGPRGFDAVAFLFSANEGEPVAALSRVASGGELSRVLLAIKGVLSTGDRVVTYVFDEVDAGVGGAVAEAIGERLAKTARERQVLCITHLPQIAAFADAHYHVEKETVDGRTVTRVTKLDDEARVAELARMLGGDPRSAREHAQALLGRSAAPTSSRPIRAKSKTRAAKARGKRARA